MERSNPDLVALARMSVLDPIAGGRAVIALAPAMAARWMLLAAAVLVSVLLLYGLPVLAGETEGMPPPLTFALWQFGLNVLAAGLVAFVGQAFGGKGRFVDALLLMGWLQALTVPFLVAQLVVILALPVFNVPVLVASVAVSIWLLTGFVCALHGFRSRLMVLVVGMMVVMVVSMILSFVLVLMGYAPVGVTDV